ncbi:MAG: TM2 domain-containing protein [Erysipelotrichaceae bacterium]
MEQNKIDLFLMNYGKYFSTNNILYIQNHLKDIDDNKFALICAIDYQDPNFLLIMSIFFGYLGIDRFLLGDMGMGILKLFTGGLCGILTVIDWFSVRNRTRENNFNKIVNLL